MSLTDLHSDIARLTRELAQERALVRSWIEKAEATRAEAERLTRERDELREKLLNREAEVEGLEAERAGGDIAIGELRASVEALLVLNQDLRAEIERLKAAVVEIGAAHVAAQTEVERQRVEIKSWGRIWNDARIIELRAEALRDGTALLD